MHLLRVLACVIIISIFCPIASFAALIGNYSGRIFDSTNNEPIEGVSVLILWTKTVIGPIEPRTLIADVKHVYTDKNGEYHIPLKYVSTILFSALDEIYVIIYQPGYQAITAHR